MALQFNLSRLPGCNGALHVNDPLVGGATETQSDILLCFNEFLRQLAIMKQNNALLDQHRQAFYDLLLTQRESFEQFYKSQVSYFKQDASAFLGGLDDAEIAELYASFPQGQFTKGKSDYYKFVQAEVEKYILRQWKRKLRDLWQEKTGTKDPKDWSDHYSMPINEALSR